MKILFSVTYVGANVKTSMILPVILQEGNITNTEHPSPGDLPDPGIDQDLLHCRWILYQLRYEGTPSGVPEGRWKKTYQGGKSDRLGQMLLLD